MELGTRRALEILAGYLPPIFKHSLLLAALSLATASAAFLAFFWDYLDAALLFVLLNIVVEGIGEASKNEAPFSGFLRSVVGRYADALIIFGAALYVGPVYLDKLMVNPALVGVLAVAGMIMIDYTRVRALKEGMNVKGELGSRSDLVFILLFSFLLGRPFEGLIFVCLMANITALYRLYSVSDTISTK